MNGSGTVAGGGLLGSGSVWSLVVLLSAGTTVVVLGMVLATVISQWRRGRRTSALHRPESRAGRPARSALTVAEITHRLQREAQQAREVHCRPPREVQVQVQPRIRASSPTPRSPSTWSADAQDTAPFTTLGHHDEHE